MKSWRRNPKNYDGCKITSHTIEELLPVVLKHVSNVYGDRGDLIMDAWSSIMGPNLSGMTQAVSFENGVLYVKVRNSTLYSLLTQHDKPRILKKLRQKFPGANIKTIVFRMG
jgi:hypothetical protein